MIDLDPDESLMAAGVTRPWRVGAAKTRLRPILTALIALGLECPLEGGTTEQVPGYMYETF